MFIRAAAFCAVLIASAAAVPAADFHAGLEAYKLEDYATALRELRPLAEQGVVEAQYYVARIYHYGDGFKDDALAARWYRAAAQQGHARSQNNLGVLYDAGRGVPQDAAQSATWYRRAADQGLAVAQTNLGRLYEEGRGLTLDAGKAATWYRSAALQGHAEAQFRLGASYEHGRGVPQDRARAIDLYRKAAKRGHPGAKSAFESLTGGARISRKAAKKAKSRARKAGDAPVVAPLAGSTRTVRIEAVPDEEPVVLSGPRGELRERAARGDVDAMYRLGYLHSTGQDVDLDPAEGLEWYLEAARLGHSMAAYRLAFMYLRGVGVPDRDYVRAYAWLSLSGTGDAGDWRDKIAKKMSADEIAEAEQLIEDVRTGSAHPSDGDRDPG